MSKLGVRPRSNPAGEDAPSPRFNPIIQRSAAGLGVSALIAITLVACSSSQPSGPPTARVTRASVTTGVTSTGSLSAITEQNLGFLKGGKVTAVNVKVGDRVTKGQVLATIDDFALRQSLAQQQAQLNSQQAVLNRIVNGTQVSGAQDSLGQAKQILDATQDQVDAQIDADDSAVDRAKKQLDVDKKALSNAKKQRSIIKDNCGSSSGSSSSSSSSSSNSDDDDDNDSDNNSDSDSDKDKKKQDQDDSSSSITSSLPDLSSLTGLLAGATGSSGTSCEQQVAQADAAVITAQRQVEASKTTLDAAEQKQNVDKAAGQVSVENSRQGVVTAQNTLDSASSDRPFNIDQQRALVANGQALVRAAQRDVDDTTLRAPVDGTVSAINGSPGEFLAASSGVTAQAPGSDAAIPGTESAGSASASGGAASVTRPGGSQFIVLQDVNQLQVVLPFEESDAANIAPNQNVSVNFDAIPDLTRNGTVLGVSPSGTSISGVISYYVTVVLNESDPRLRDGQTARATVLTQQLDNVLSVPNAAVRRDSGKSEVTVLGANGEQSTVEFQPGVVGSDRTQVLSGLFDGQEVVLPAGR